MITKLTEDQETLMEVVRDERLEIGLAVGKANENEMRTAIRLWHRCGNRPEPDHVIFFDSPKAGAIAVSILQQHYAQFPEANFGHSPLPEDLHDQVRSLMRSKALPDYIRTAAREAYSTAEYGYHESAKLAFYDFFRQIGVNGLERMEGRFAVAHCCGWWWSLPNIAVVTHRATKLHLDDEKRMHCEKGPAIEFADGWGMHCWHGIHVPKRFITDPTSVTEKDLDEIESREQNNLAALLAVPLPAEKEKETQGLAAIHNAETAVVRLQSFREPFWNTKTSPPNKLS